MKRKIGLELLAGNEPSVLILGSFPSELSLRGKQYYANPRNQFWHLIETLTGIDRNLPYPERAQALTDRGIALWDVLHSCERAGSLDTSIELRTARVNDIRALMQQRPSITTIGLNGGTATKMFDRYFADLRAQLQVVTLPSSSSAHAVKIEQKIHAWRTCANSLSCGTRLTATTKPADERSHTWRREEEVALSDYNKLIEKHEAFNEAVEQLSAQTDEQLASLRGAAGARKLRAVSRSAAKLHGRLKADKKS